MRQPTGPKRSASDLCGSSTTCSRHPHTASPGSNHLRPSPGSRVGCRDCTWELLSWWRHCDPVLLAKEAASLQFLSGGRLVLGLGTGWNPAEFAAMGVPRSERGRRTDELLAALRELLGRSAAGFEGRHLQFPEVSVEPRPEPRVPIWVGGGTQPTMPGASEHHGKAPASVIRRVAASDGWCAPPHAGPAELAADWERICEAARELGRGPEGIEFAQQGYFHLVEDSDRERALERQREAFEYYLGPARPWPFAQANYLVGTIDDVIARLRERAAVGAQHFVLGPVTAEPLEFKRQIELFAARVAPALT